ncbi:MAG: hypothetical protein QOE11_59 [Solirubrobacteraceae bacterium]|jgi:hypothetical protein|nr:hypothetical protein [Solirubrobacteraceae bacterium]
MMATRAAGGRYGATAMAKKKSEAKDPIRKLLAGVAPTLFLGNPAGTVAIFEERIIDAGGDPEEVLAWVREQGGYPDKTFTVTKRHLISPAQRPPAKVYYVVPEDALK